MYFFLHVCLHICIHIVFFQVDLRHLQENKTADGIIVPEVDLGIDLTEFYMSVEWDILEVLHYLYLQLGFGISGQTKTFAQIIFSKRSENDVKFCGKKYATSLHKIAKNYAKFFINLYL